MCDFQGCFPGLSRTSSFNFQLFRTKVIFWNFPAPGIFKKKTQDFPGDVGTLLKLTVLQNLVKMHIFQLS